MSEPKVQLTAIQPTVTSPMQPQHNDSKRRLIIITALAVALVAVASISYFHWFHTTGATDQPHDFSQLADYKLAGLSSGHGISFKKPTQLFADPTNTYIPQRAAFNFLVNGYTAAYVAASTTSSSSIYQLASLSTISKALSDPKSTDYALYIGRPQAFVKQNAASGVNVTYSDASAFTNQSIKANAWKLDFNLTDPVTKKTGQGEVVYILSKSAYYLFMIEAHNSDWSANQSAWTQILNSLKIDQ